MKIRQTEIIRDDFDALIDFLSRFETGRSQEGRVKNDFEFDRYPIVHTTDHFTLRIGDWIHCKKEETCAGFFYNAGGCGYDLFHSFVYFLKKF